MSNFKVLVFDWDGTLSDSLARIVTCLQLSAEEVGLNIPTEEEGRDIVGLGLKEALVRLFPGVDDRQIDDLRNCYSRHYVVLDKVPPPFFDTVMDSLEKLRTQGYLLSVATGKSRRGLDRVLGGHRLEGFFHATRCADETRSKPHPLMLEELAGYFDVTPDKMCMVGDTEFDMEMAVRAGVPRIGVSYGAHSAERLENYNLLGCLDQFSHIFDTL